MILLLTNDLFSFLIYQAINYMINFLYIDLYLQPYLGNNPNILSHRNEVLLETFQLGNNEPIIILNLF
jgi:hypothetical protein